MTLSNSQIIQTLRAANKEAHKRIQQLEKRPKSAENKRIKQLEHANHELTIELSTLKYELLYTRELYEGALDVVKHYYKVNS